MFRLTLTIGMQIAGLLKRTSTNLEKYVCKGNDLGTRTKKVESKYEFDHCVHLHKCDCPLTTSSNRFLKLLPCFCFVLMVYQRVQVRSSFSNASPITSPPTRSALRFSSQPSLDTQSTAGTPTIGNWSPPPSLDRNQEFTERGRTRARPSPPPFGGRKTFQGSALSPQQQQQQQGLVHPRAIHPSHGGQRSPIQFRAASLDRSPMVGTTAPASPDRDRGLTNSVRPVSPSPSLLRKRSPSPSLAHLYRSAVLAAVQLSWQELAHASKQQRYAVVCNLATCPLNVFPVISFFVMRWPSFKYYFSLFLNQLISI